MSFPGSVKRWLGFTRRERSGTFVLALILVVVVIIRVTCFVPSAEEMMSKAKADSVAAEAATVGVTESSDTLPQPWYFDPNSASAGELVSLGLSERQAATLVNYRLSGGRFYSAEDFRKVYGVTRELQERLIPYIVIEKREPSYETQVRQGSVRPGPGAMTGMTEAASAGRIELNGADSALLVSLRGIGPVLSRRIIRYRELLGGYLTTGQLSEVYGIDSTLAAFLVECTEADTTLVKRININKASYGEIARHPYLTGEHARLILKYRELAGEFTDLSQLVVNNIVSREEYIRVYPYLEIN
ncbi:MAG: helix-hairpin-helix domain-containing protein [Bacteroidales bacterium]